MRLLAVADEEDKGLWDYYSRDKLQGAELILACGDLTTATWNFWPRWRRSRCSMYTATTTNVMTRTRRRG